MYLWPLRFLVRPNVPRTMSVIYLEMYFYLFLLSSSIKAKDKSKLTFFFSFLPSKHSQTITRSNIHLIKDIHFHISDASVSVTASVSNPTIVVVVHHKRKCHQSCREFKKRIWEKIGVTNLGKEICSYSTVPLLCEVTLFRCLHHFWQYVTLIPTPQWLTLIMMSYVWVFADLLQCLANGYL